MGRNLLPPDADSFEYGSTGQWVQQTGTVTIANDATVGLTGTHSLKLTSGAAATFMASQPYSTNTYIPCVAGNTYTFMASFRPASTARTSRLFVTWYDSGKVTLGDSSNSDVVEAANPAWTQNLVAFTAPASATYMSLRAGIVSAASAEIHNMDQCGIFDGSVTYWEPVDTPYVPFSVTSANSTSTGTTLAGSSNTYAVGDVHLTYFAMDATAGAVSFAQSAGTGTLGSFTTIQDTTVGSGAAGVRFVVAWARCTVAGTATITATHPSVVSRVIDGWPVRGGDTNNPIITSSVSTSAAPAATPTPGTGLLAMGLFALDGASGTAVTTSISGQGGTLQIVTDTTTAGNANVSVASTVYARSANDGADLTPSTTGGSGNRVWITVLVRGASRAPGPPTTMNRTALKRASTW